MKKSIKLIFCGKNDAQIGGFSGVKNVPSPSKNVFRKKNPSSLSEQIRSSKRCVEIFLKEIGLEIFNFR